MQRSSSERQSGAPTSGFVVHATSAVARALRQPHRRPRLLPALALAVGSLLLGPVGGGAQALRPWGQNLALSVGVLRSGQVDETISPLHFVGSGAAISLGWGRTRAASSLEAGLDAGGAILAPADRASGPGERLAHASVRLAALRALGPGGEGALALGVGARAFATVTGYRSAPSEPMQSAYLFGAIMLGPLARWHGHTPAGELEVEAGTGLLSWVDHPYGSIDRGRPLLDFRLALPTSLPNGSARVAWTARSGRRLELVAAYRLDYMAYRDLQPVRSVGQSLSLGVRIRPRWSGA